MPHPVIDLEECSSCEACVDACEHGVFAVVDGDVAVVNKDACIDCDSCKEECPLEIIEIVEDQYFFFARFLVTCRDKDTLTGALFLGFFLVQVELL